MRGLRCGPHGQAQSRYLAALLGLPRGEVVTTIPAALRAADQAADERQARKRRMQKLRREAEKGRFRDSGLTAAELLVEHRRLKVEFLQRESVRRAA